MQTLSDYIEGNRNLLDADLDNILREAFRLKENPAFLAILAIVESETVALMARAAVGQEEDLKTYQITLRVIKRIRNDLEDFIKKTPSL